MGLIEWMKKLLEYVPEPGKAPYIVTYIRSPSVAHSIRSVRVKGKRVRNELGSVSITVKGEEDE